MPDFTPSNPGALFSARQLAVITPSDTTDLTNVRALWVGGTGSLVIRALDDSANTTLTITTPGVIIPIFVKRVMAATTATEIVGLY
jgi:hypothetical protein